SWPGPPGTATTATTSQDSSAVAPRISRQESGSPGASNQRRDLIRSTSRVRLASDSSRSRPLARCSTTLTETSATASSQPRWVGYAFAICSFVLLPWTVWLYQSLPSRTTADNWDVAWAGFDVAIAIALLATAVGALRCASWTQGAAAAAATLLVCDAWFDV